MKKLAVMLLFGGFVGLNSCVNSTLPQNEITDIELSTRSCDPDQEYQSNLKRFLARYFQVPESLVTVSYDGLNGAGEHVFLFSVGMNNHDITGAYIVEDLCIRFDQEYIIQDRFQSVK